MHGATPLRSPVEDAQTVVAQTAVAQTVVMENTVHMLYLAHRLWQRRDAQHRGLGSSDTAAKGGAPADHKAAVFRPARFRYRVLRSRRRLLGVR